MGDLTPLDRAIWTRFRVKPGDSLPYVGYARSTRVTLAEFFAAQGFTHGAEIGVAYGEYSEILCQTIPGLRLLAVDPWMRYSRSGRQAQSDEMWTAAHQRLVPYDVTFLRKRSVEAAADVPDASLDFVYIDGLHDFDPVMLDLIHWCRKVRPGGMVAGHDFYNFYNGGVVDAVYAYTRSHHIDHWYITNRDRYQSYFWVHTGSPTRWW